MGQGSLSHRHTLVVDMAKVGYLDVPPPDPGILEGGRHCLQGQGGHVLFRKPPEGVEPYPHHHNVTAGAKLGQEFASFLGRHL